LVELPIATDDAKEKSVVQSKLTRKTKSSYPEVRFAALAKLAESDIDKKVLLPLMMRIASDLDESSDLRSKALETLATPGTDVRAVLPALLAIVRSAADDQRCAALKVLEVCQPDPAVTIPVLRSIIDTEEKEHRRLAELSERDDPYLENRVPMARHEELVVCALQALQPVGRRASAALPCLVTALSSPSNQIRLRAVAVIGEIGPNAKAAIPQLDNMREDACPSVRQAANAALDRIRRAE
jgi:HEAT repeat protein